MDRYQRVEKPKPETPINENEIRVTSQGVVRNYINYATSLLQDKQEKEIVLKAMGQAISKTVAIAEIIKKRIPRLHQDIVISSVSITDVWEPIEEGLVPLETTRQVSMISITLSPTELNKNSPGYQAPTNVDQSKQQYQQLQPYNRQSRGPYNAGIHLGEGVAVVEEVEAEVRDGAGVVMDHTNIKRMQGIQMVDIQTGEEVVAEAETGAMVVVDGVAMVVVTEAMVVVMEAMAVVMAAMGVETEAMVAVAEEKVMVVVTEVMVVAEEKTMAVVTAAMVVVMGVMVVVTGVMVVVEEAEALVAEMGVKVATEAGMVAMVAGMVVMEAKMVAMVAVMVVMVMVAMAAEVEAMVVVVEEVVVIVVDEQEVAAAPVAAMPTMHRRIDVAPPCPVLLCFKNALALKSWKDFKIC
ncbi:hypothetical protein V2J09_005117 [Rumex salicifolius]